MYILNPDALLHTHLWCSDSKKDREDIDALSTLLAAEPGLSFPLLGFEDCAIINALIMGLLLTAQILHASPSDYGGSWLLVPVFPHECPTANERQHTCQQLH